MVLPRCQVFREGYPRLTSRLRCWELRVYGEHADRFFPGAEPMIRWINQPCLVSSMPRVAPPDREALRAEVIERMVQATRQPESRCFEKAEIRSQKSAPKPFGVRSKDGGLAADGEQEVEKPQMARSQVVLGLSKLGAFRAAGGDACEGGFCEL